MTHTNRPAILRAMLALSGLSTNDYGLTRLAGRPRQTIEAWLNGRNQIPSRTWHYLTTQPEYPEALRMVQELPQEATP